MSGGLVFALARAVTTGEITVVSKVSSRMYYFAESPVLFSVFFALYAALTGLVIWATVVVARRSFARTISNR
jgi:hypothetical protein